MLLERAVSSAEEHFLDMEGVTSSILVPPTIIFRDLALCRYNRAHVSPMTPQTPLSPGEAHREKAKLGFPVHVYMLRHSLRLRPGQCRTRHKGYSGLAWPPGHSAHGALHRIDAYKVQGLLEIASMTTFPTCRDFSGHRHGTIRVTWLGRQRMMTEHE
jgi:hypothetical protein